jgi:iron complex outermembrane recepter protein
MERIEVLPGPQGTLYGASSQAGTVRLITNKPVVGEFQARLGAEYSQTAKGEDSNKVEAMINIPLIDNKLALSMHFVL